MEDKTIPEFAIVQNSRTKVSGVWTKNGGRWIEADKSEYEMFRLLSQLIRGTDDPLSVLRMIEKENPEVFEE